MKINLLLKINYEQYKIVSNSIVLEEKAPGRAIFVVQSAQKLSGIIQVFLGVGNNYRDCFTGYIEKSLQIDKKQQRIIAKTPAAVLKKRWPISKRNTTATEVLQELGNNTGCAFNLENASWNKSPIPHFINIGNGFEALTLIGREFNIEDFTWLDQPDGSIYIGSLANSNINKTIINIPATFFTDLSVAGASCPVVPGLRPGKRLRIGNSSVITIEKTTITGETMRLNF